MSKISDYFITGVWKDSQKRITHVFLHTVSENNTFDKGVKNTEADTISLLKRNYIIRTITWSYPNWANGAAVLYESRNGNEFLITERNTTTKDNLDNSIPMDHLI